jgi:hypothetical protein
MGTQRLQGASKRNVTKKAHMSREKPFKVHPRLSDHDLLEERIKSSLKDKASKAPHHSSEN